MNWLLKHYQGILLCLGIAIIAYFLGNLLPLIGGPVFGIMIGILMRNIDSKVKSIESGINFSSKKVLQAAIILLGCGLNLNEIYHAGISSLAIIITTIAAALLTAYFLGRFLRVDFGLKSLIGVGTAICGGSAIAAIAPVIEAEEKDISYAISTVFLFNIAAVFIFPPLGHLLGMTEPGFGLLAGSAINDTSSVVAAGYVYGNAAGDYAVIVKLTRTLMIIPIALLFVWLMIIRHKKAHEGKTGKSHKKFNLVKIFPWFILGFLLLATLKTSGWVDEKAMNFLKEAGKFLIIMALAAIGLKTDIRQLFHTGLKPGLLGMAIWIVITFTSLLVQYLSGQW